MKRYNKLVILFLTLVVLLAFTGCSGGSIVNQSDKRVLNAISVLEEHWGEVYEQDDTIEDKYLEIINTKIINIKSNINSKEVHEREYLFDRIDYIVEFELMSNWLNTAPYYSNAKISDCVVVYKSGNMEVIEKSPITMYRTTTYSNDFSPIVESIEEFNSQYDQVLEIE